MKQFRHFALAILLSAVALSQTSQPVITGRCQNSGTYPNCVGGEIVFSGSSYSGQVHVKVTNSAGDVIDESDYTTSDGVLSFVENLSFADTYTISVNGQAALTVTTQ